MLENLSEALDLATKTSTLTPIVLAYLAGALVSFTPCVYPLIPVTVSYIGAQESAGRATGFILSLAYVLGTSVVYTAIGLAAAFSGSFFGSFQTNPWVTFTVANVFLLMGCAMLEFFVLPIPSFLRAQLFSPKRRGIAGALLLGLASGLVMSPCSAPVLTVLLGYVASRQNTLLGSLMLFSFSLGMGTLLIILGTFTGLLRSIPRSGPWLVYVQKGFGLVFVAMAEYYLVKTGIFLM